MSRRLVPIALAVAVTAACTLSTPLDSEPQHWAGFEDEQAAADGAGPASDALVQHDPLVLPPQDERVDDERARLDLLEQKNAVLVDRYVENAQTLLDRLDFEGAEQALLSARDIDPNDPRVLELLGQVQAALGRPEGQSASVRASAAQRYEAYRQQLIAQARQQISDARDAMAVEDYDAAVVLLQDVVNQARYASQDVPWGSLPAEAEQLLGEARRGRDMAGAEELRRKQSEAYSKLRDEEERAEEQERVRVQMMLAAGLDRFDSGDYAGAHDLATAVLEVSPRNDRAITLLEAAKEARRENASDAFVEARKEEFLRWREAMEDVRVPHNQILTAPDKETWAEITRRRAGVAAVGLDAPDPEELALRERLRTATMDAEFDDNTITQVANNIFFSTDIPVSVDPEVALELDDNAEYVTLTGLRDVTVEALLNIIVNQVGDELAWTTRNGRVYITRQEKAEGEPEVRIHNIQDLTFGLTDFKGPDLRDIPLPGGAGDDNETTIFPSELDRLRLIEPEDVLNLVQENIARESWDVSDFYRIDFVDNNNLLVIHTPDVQAQVAAFLDDLRAFSASMVTLEARFYAITDAFIEEIGSDFRGLGPGGNLGDEFEIDDFDPQDVTEGLDNSGDGTSNPNAGVFFDDGDDSAAFSSENFFGNPLGNLLSTVGGGAFQFTILDDTQVNLVLTAVEKSTNAIEVTAPVVSVYNTQRAFVTVVNQVSFVQGFDVDVANAAFIADPNIGIVQEGIVLDVRPTISYDRKYVTLDVQTTVANLVRPIRRFETSLGGTTTQVQFFLPELEVQNAQTTVVVPDGGTVVLGGFKQARYKNRTAEAPWFADIPVLGFFFQEKGLSDEMQDLIIVMTANITDYSAMRAAPVAGVRR